MCYISICASTAADVLLQLQLNYALKCDGVTLKIKTDSVAHAVAVAVPLPRSCCWDKMWCVCHISFALIVSWERWNGRVERTHTSNLFNLMVWAHIHTHLGCAVECLRIARTRNKWAQGPCISRQCRRRCAILFIHIYFSPYFLCSASATAASRRGAYMNIWAIKIRYDYYYSYYYYNIYLLLCAFRLATIAVWCNDAAHGTPKTSPSGESAVPAVVIIISSILVAAASLFAIPIFSFHRHPKQLLWWKCIFPLWQNA